MTDRPASVRMATMADMEALIDLCVVMHEECAMHGGFVEQRVRDGLTTCLDRQGGVCGVIDGKASDGEPVILGGIALVWMQQWFTNDWNWNDRFIYVRPESRSAAAWKSLADFAKWFTDAVSPPGGEEMMPMVVGVFQPPKRIEGLCRLFRHQFVQVGGIFIYGDTTKCGRLEVSHE